MIAAPPPRRLRAHLLRFAVVVVGIGGCNAILDNEPGHRDETTTSSDVAPTQPIRDAAPAPPPPVENVPAPVAPDSGVGVPPCGAGWRMCNGFCVPPSDPLYGCGDPSCAPCKAAHGLAVCKEGKCALAGCDPGRADCNQDSDDGCETDLSKATTCGSCTSTCPPTSPVCAPSGASFACSTGCPLSAPRLCGVECVDPLTSVNHCGGCNQKCADVDHALVECRAALCTFSCRQDYHACGGKCAAATDPAACGPTCTVCPAVAHAVPTCQADACGFQCATGFANCNGLPGDGCEVNLATDPANCNGCGISCNGGGCVNGTCQPPPPP